MFSFGSSTRLADCLQVLSYAFILTICIAQCKAQQGNSGTTDGNTAGASGPSQSSVNLSRQGLIILCIIGGVVAILGIISAILFLMAKERQWKMRQAILPPVRGMADDLTSPLSGRFQRAAVTPNIVGQSTPIDGRFGTHGNYDTKRLRSSRYIDLQKAGEIEGYDHRREQPF